MQRNTLIETSAPDNNQAGARFIWGITFILLVIFWAILLWGVQHLMKEREAQVRRQTGQFTHALALQVTKMLDSLKAAMIPLAEHTPEHAYNPAQIAQLIRKVGKELPASFHFGYFDEKGRGIVSTLPGFVPGRSYADRDYFRIQHDQAEAGFHIGSPITGRTTGMLILPVSRRVSDTEGRILGVLLGTIDTRSFAELFDSFSSGPRDTIALIHLETKQIVARIPDPEKFFAKDISRAPLFSHVGTGDSGVYEDASGSDGVLRLIFWHRLTDAPLAVVVGLAREDLDAAARPMMRTVFIVGGIVTLLGIALGAAVTGMQRRHHEAFAAQTAAKEKIRHLAHHDPLTGLPNRLYLSIALEQALAIATRERFQLALMFLDMDRFKQINDALGHHVGDDFLIEVGRRLRTCVRESDIVARLGGDEFVVVLSHISNPADAAGVANKILHALNEVFTVGPHQLHSSPSIGISIYPNDGETVAALMKNADLAMYRAKDSGRNNAQFYSA